MSRECEGRGEKKKEEKPEEIIIEKSEEEKPLTVKQKKNKPVEEEPIDENYNKTTRELKEEIREKEKAIERLRKLERYYKHHDEMLRKLKEARLKKISVESEKPESKPESKPEEVKENKQTEQTEQKA